jgi:transposase-like protein
MTEITFDVLYYRGDGSVSHQYPETWRLSALHCPHCGQQQVWQEDASSETSRCLCAACGGEFVLCDEVSLATGPQNAQRLSAIKGVAKW